MGYSIWERMTSQLAVNGQPGVALRRPTRTVVHPDRGNQFRSRTFARGRAASAAPVPDDSEVARRQAT